LWNEELNEKEQKKLVSLELWTSAGRKQWQELGLDVLLDEKELNEIRALREAEELRNNTTSASSSSSTRSRKKVLKKPKPAK
jgi:hypothetical protein